MKKPVPECFKGFENIHRHFDSSMNAVVAKIKPGEFYLTNQNEWITTVLGSCIAACIHDPSENIGGMNHFMLPSDGMPSEGNPANSAARYGNWAMEYLINGILSRGGKRRNLQVRLFGGAEFRHATAKVGLKNVSFVKQYIYDEDLTLLVENLGGNVSRTVMFHPISGKCLMKAVPVSEDAISAENRYLTSINDKQDQQQSDDIELF